MQSFARTAFALILFAAACVAAPFDAGWRFYKGDATGAENPEFAGPAWRPVDLPHDWSIEGPFDQKNPAGGAGAFLPASIGWYRKSFTLPETDARRRVFVDFDGVMANSEVWINGFHLGKRPYGYVSFRYELTGHLKFGKEANVIAVRADNSGQPASRWYAGAGIYRHVRLVTTDPVHFEHWATFVTGSAHLQTAVVNQSASARSVSVAVTIFAPDGSSVKSVETEPKNIAAGQSADFAAEIPIASPVLWQLDRPAMYRAVAEVRAGKTTLDEETVPFGIREARFDADTGLWLNGRNFKIKGVCLHHEGGAVGAAVPLSVWERRLARLKQLGVNAIRTAHNPPAPEFLDLCDRMGFLVMDEMFDCWTVAKNPYDYHLYFRDWSHEDTRDTVRRDRNHPSVILYSAGNEIHDTPRADLAKDILRGLVEVFHTADPTRPVTQALFRPNVSHDYEDGLADLLDVVGQNYRENEILAAHAAKPARKIIGTENQHGRAVWLALRDNPAYAGQFLWSGIDYLGESRFWPVIASGAGLLDRTGGFKPVAYERQSWWSESPMVYMTRRVAPTAGPVTDPGYETAVRRATQVLFPDWTPSNQAAHEENVEVYSNCDEVELLLNGKSLGVKTRPADASARNWKVAFEPGTLEAVATNGGKAAARHVLRTAGKAARIVLATENRRIGTTWDDVAFVTATVVDDRGTAVPSADPEIAFQVAGPGAIVAVDNADNTSHEPFQASARHAYQGECVAIVRGKGRFRVNATAPGLAGGTVSIEVAPR